MRAMLAIGREKGCREEGLAFAKYFTYESPSLLRRGCAGSKAPFESGETNTRVGAFVPLHTGGMERKSRR